MINRIIHFCAHQRGLTLLVTLVLTLLGIEAMRAVPLDAIPDLSDQQVIILSRWDQSPDRIEDQVTYPIVTALLGAPKVTAIRGFSDFGYSYVYVVFEDDTDIYWARSRVLEYLSKITPRLPQGVTTELGPDATSLGWVFQYALVDRTQQRDLGELRSLHDWHVRFLLQSVPGVAEIAPIGGFVQQYQVEIDPQALLSYQIPLPQITTMLRQSNQDIGARLIELGGAEYMVRGRGYLHSVADIESIVVGNQQNGVPVRIRDVGRVTLGPDVRRGVAELDGRGEVVGGVAIMRYGENALAVIDRLKTRMAEIGPSLPAGVEFVPVYDRSELIRASVHTISMELLQELLIVAAVILLFLWHFSSAMIPIVTIPVAVLLSFLPFKWLGVTANIMSLAGIAIAIGDLVDSSIVMVENVHKRLERWRTDGSHGDPNVIMLGAITEVGRASFYSLLVMALAFVPIFALQAQEGKLFQPLAYTKTLALGMGALLGITAVPALVMSWIRVRPLRWSWLGTRGSALANRLLVGTIRPETAHPVSRWLHRLYGPAVNWVLRRPYHTVALAFALLLATLYPFFRLGSEFMPPLNEGVLLYMPTTTPGLSATEAARLLQRQDAQLAGFPEVAHVFGKAGRADTATDPAPFSMMETIVQLKAGVALTPALTARFDAAMQFPGTTNAWTMPIKTRLDMLATGIRTPVGIKIMGPDLAAIEQLGIQIESLLRDVPGTRGVFAERVTGGYFLDIDLQREQLARYGLSVQAVHDVIASAVGGETLTTLLEGRARYAVSVRYPRELRDDLPDLARVLIPTPAGAQIPLGEIATIHLTTGPGMIRNENGLLAGYVSVDVADSVDLGTYVTRAKAALAGQLRLPPQVVLQWSGQYEYMERVARTLRVVVPVTLCLILLLIYLNTRSTVKTAIVLLAVPFSLVGAIWLLYLLGYHVSIATWVGMIALLGLDAETGIFMLMYLDLAHDDAVAAGRMQSTADLHAAIHHGAVARVRPKVMTVAINFLGLLPAMWAMGEGADTMKRIAAPMVGGVFTSFLMELLVYPALYLLWKRRTLPAPSK